MSAGEEESQRQKAEGRDISRELEPVEDTYQKALSCAKSRRKDNREQGLSLHRAQSDPKERQPRELIQRLAARGPSTKLKQGAHH